MARLTREQVLAVVVESLRSVADITGDAEQASLTGFNDFQRDVFLSTLLAQVNALPFFKNDGSTSDKAYYDLPLTRKVFDGWKTVKGCIDWVVQNHVIIVKNKRQ